MAYGDQTLESDKLPDKILPKPNREWELGSSAANYGARCEADGIDVFRFVRTANRSDRAGCD